MPLRYGTYASVAAIPPSAPPSHRPEAGTVSKRIDISERLSQK